MIKKYKILWGIMLLILIVLVRSLLFLPDGELHIIACNVGQGDGLLIIKDSIQIVVDGGPNNAISSCVSNHVPFWDREIEMVILTNPDFDHYYGLIELVKSYNIDLFVANDIKKEGEEYKALTDTIKQKDIAVSNPLAGTQMKVGDISLDFVWPQEIGSRSINELSLVFNLRYGEFDALFTGDIEPGAIDEVIQTGKIYDIDYLKVPHHGSRNGLSYELLEISNPELAVISSGKNNRYGHPSPEVIKLLSDQGTKILRTDLQGEVEVITDGESWWVK